MGDWEPGDWEPIEIITAERGSEVYRQVCAYAGKELRPEMVGPGEVIVAKGYGSPYQTADALRHALGDDNAVVYAIYRSIDGLQVGVTWAAFCDPEFFGNRAAVIRRTF